MTSASLITTYSSSAGRDELSSRWERSGSVMGHAITFLIPCLSFVELQIYGRLFLSEVLLLFMWPALMMMRGHWLLKPLPAVFITLAVSWLIAQIGTDFIRYTPFEDYSRGWAKISFTITNFIALYLLLYGCRARLLVYLFGLSVGFILSYFHNPLPLAEDAPWKFGVGPPVNQMVIIACCLPLVAKRRALPAIVLLSMAVANIALGARSQGGELFMTAMILVLQWAFTAGFIRFRYRTFATTAAMVVLFVGAIGSIELYGYAASQGWLGEEAYDKYSRQTATTVGLILGGRSEILVSSEAIAEAPILGHGSWAKDPKFVELELELVKYGFAVNPEHNTEGLIPSHSHIFGAWVEAGIVGAIFWFWLFVMALRVLVGICQEQDGLSALIVFIALEMIWNIPFSPFVWDMRLYDPFCVIVLFFGLQVIRRAREFPLPFPLSLASPAQPRPI